MDSTSRNRSHGSERLPLSDARGPQTIGKSLFRLVAAASSVVGALTLLTLYRIEANHTQQTRLDLSDLSWSVQLDSSHEQNAKRPAALFTPTQARSSASPEILVNLTVRQEARKKRVADVCAANPSLGQNDRPWQYKVDHKRRIIYCPIPKAGWSSWKRVLFYVNGMIPNVETDVGVTSDQKAGILDMSAPGVAYLQSMTSQDFFTFVFVRNPWERLVSAYINKAVDWNYTRIMHQPCSWETEMPYSQPITFSQFLKCIAESDSSSANMDMHWIPMWRLCDFCRIHYDYIGHLETIYEDAKYIIQKKNLNVVFPRTFYSKAFNTQDVINEWYKAVPCPVLESLRKIYALDFLLHDYSDIPPGWKDSTCNRTH